MTASPRGSKAAPGGTVVHRVAALVTSVAVFSFVAASWPTPGTSSALAGAPTTLVASTQDSPATPPKTATLAGGTELAEWSDRVWIAAKSGDMAAVEASLKAVPNGTAVTEIERIRSMAIERFAHAAASKDDRTAEVEKATKELAEHLASSDVSKALTAAVKLQTLSDDWKLPLQREDVRKAIQLAEDTDVKAQASGDWLLSQEVLFRLRTLYEDAGDRATFKKYAEALEKVNRRIGLLAQYAPKQLHELRRIQAARLAPTEKFPEWNPAFAEDWKEQVRDITRLMLTAAMKRAATTHISSKGWEPLIEGGIDAVGILATTDALGETFPGLADAAKVRAFTEAVERTKKTLMNLPADKVTANDYSDAITSLQKANIETVDLPEPVLFHEFGDGAVDELASRFEDQYTEIIWPERLRRFQQQIDGDFVGVGILIRHDDKREIVVVNPLEGSPAARGGIKAEDRLVGVNGAPTTGWSLNKAVEQITGPAGEEVTLNIKRTGVECAFDVKLDRERIKIRSVNGWWKKGLDESGAPQWDWYVDPAAGIGYVRLTGFSEESYADFRAAITQMKAERQLNGLILDLRHNPGGLLNSAVDFTNAFVPSGTVVSGEDRNGREVFNLQAQPRRADLQDLPLVVLVNQGSASASEIVSGALQVHDAAVILGERSFGKGSVQTVHDISDKSSAAIKLTTQYYILPPAPGEKHGRLVHKKAGAEDWGVNPDLVVKMTPEQIEKSLELRQQSDIIEEWKDEKDRKPRPDPKELLTKNLDPQLETALLILQARALKTIDAAAMAAASGKR
ncbi:MAG: S41 family peptidase [Phycisphaerae bacterium]|nr:S41 family peptidase [Phycisphaerae bacterium]